MDAYKGRIDPVIEAEILRIDNAIAAAAKRVSAGAGDPCEILELQQDRAQWVKHRQIDKSLGLTSYVIRCAWAKIEAFEERRVKLATGNYEKRTGCRSLWKKRKADRPKCGYPTKAGGSCQAPCVFGRSYCRLHGGNAGPKTEQGRARIAEAQKQRWVRSPMPK